MAIDKAITELDSATEVQEEDLFVLQQNGVAKKLSGTYFIDFLHQYGVVINGQLWTAQQVYLLGQVLQSLRYSSASAGTIATQLINSLNETAVDIGWSKAEINMLDEILSYAEYTDPQGGEYADMLIASLNGAVIEQQYEDADEEEY